MLSGFQPFQIFCEIIILCFVILTSELGFRIGEILGIDYTKDIDYETHEIRVNFREDNENSDIVWLYPDVYALMPD